MLGVKYSFYYYFSHLTPIYLVESDRKGKITWGKLVKDPKSLVNSRFLLSSKLENPTKMTLDAISEYWNDWVLKVDEDDLFSFFDFIGEEDQDKGDGGGEMDIPPPFMIDVNFSPPLLCGETSKNCTQYLESWVAGREKHSKIFRVMVSLVGTFGVNCSQYMIFYYIS